MKDDSWSYFLRWRNFLDARSEASNKASGFGVLPMEIYKRYGEVLLLGLLNVLKKAYFLGALMDSKKSDNSSPETI